MIAAARAVAEQVDGRTVLTLLRSTPPISLRQTAAGLMLVGSAFWPLGGDSVDLEIVVGEAARLRIGSTAAQVAQPGAAGGPSRSAVRLTTGSGAGLHWQPQPLVITRDAEHHSRYTLDLAGGSTVIVVEVVVLGRGDEPPGRYQSRWRVRYGGLPLLSADLDVGAGAGAGWDGPAVLGPFRVLASVLVAGSTTAPFLDVVPAFDGVGEVLHLAGPGLLFSWLGADAVAAGRAVDAFLRLAGLAS